MNFLSSCFGSGSKVNLNSQEEEESPQLTVKPSDEEIIRYENELRNEQAAQGPLVSPLLPLSILHDEFPDTNFALKLDLLNSKHQFVEVRKCRRDGNCFYRAVAFDLIETFKMDPQGSIQKYQEIWKDQLKAVGFEPVIYEDFSEAFWSYLDNGNLDISLQEAWESDEYTSNMALMLLRLLTSAHIRTNPDDYLAFIELAPQDSNSIVKWCERSVDAVGVDADQVQLIALAKSLQIEIVVANLGSGLEWDDLQVTEFDFRASQDDPIVNVLYRPGHYDLLYKKQTQ